MRAYWAIERIRNELSGSVLVHVTIDRTARAKGGDVFTRNAALERIRNELDQALRADPLGVTRLHVCLTIEKGRQRDTDP